MMSGFISYMSLLTFLFLVFEPSCFNVNESWCNTVEIFFEIFCYEVGVCGGWGGERSRESRFFQKQTKIARGEYYCGKSSKGKKCITEKQDFC